MHPLVDFFRTLKGRHHSKGATARSHEWLPKRVGYLAANCRRIPSIIVDGGFLGFIRHSSSDSAWAGTSSRCQSNRTPLSDSMSRAEPGSMTPRRACFPNFALCSPSSSSIVIPFTDLFLNPASPSLASSSIVVQRPPPPYPFSLQSLRTCSSVIAGY